jgi:hypothetical protein
MTAKRTAQRPIKRGNEPYSGTEALRRMEAALRGAFNTPPKPMKEIPRKRPKARRKGEKADRRASAD